MDLNYGHFAVFIFVALPLIWLVSALGYLFYRAYQYQKALKAQSDALFKKLENR